LSSALLNEALLRAIMWHDAFVKANIAPEPVPHKSYQRREINK